MATALNLVLGIVVLIIAVWVAIFGGTGALLCQSRGGSRTAGFAWGALLGPIGWLVILWLTRGATARAEAIAPVAAEMRPWPTQDPWDD